MTYWEATDISERLRVYAQGARLRLHSGGQLVSISPAEWEALKAFVDGEQPTPKPGLEERVAKLEAKLARARDVAEASCSCVCYSVDADRVRSQLQGDCQACLLAEALSND